MAAIVICGGPHAPLAEFEARLRTMGVAAPLAPPGGQITTMPEWLARLSVSGLPVHDESPAAGGPFLRGWLSRIAGRPARASAPAIGRAWELAASEIYLSNAGVACWGWADVRNTLVLDVLDALDGATRFVMLLQSPAQALASVQSACDERIDMEAVLEAWQHATRPMLQFCRRHRQRVFLADLERWQRDAAGAAGELAQWLDLPAPDAVEPLPAPDAVLTWLMRQGMPTRSAAREQWDALRGLLPANPDPCADIDIAAAGADWLEGRREVGKRAEVRARLALLAEAESVSNRKAAAIAAERDAERKRADALDKAKAEVAAQLASTTDRHLACERNAQEQAAENDSLVRDLHRAQEELETQLRKLKHAESAGAEIAKKLAAAAESDAAAARKAGQIAVQRDAEKKRADVLAGENAALAAKLAVATEGNGASLRKAREQAEENATLLLELHQVQEELESHFHRFKDKERDAARLATRLANVLKSHPDHVEWDEAGVSDEAGGAVRVTFRGLLAAGASLPEIAVVARTAGRAATLSLDAGQPALAWSGAPGDLPLVLDGSARPRSAAHGRMARLPTTAWAICKALPNATRRALLEHKRLDDAGAKALATLQARLAALQSVWRVDGVALFNEQVNADYEHLWLHLHNASFAGRSWPRFEFRIGAANVRRGSFSTQPKYEFPLQCPGPHQFENWREESADDGGPRFELRFDTTTGSMDLGAWDALTTDDQSQLIAMMLELPRWLDDLAGAGQRISRDWTDWISLNNRALEILHARLVRPAERDVPERRPDPPAASSPPVPTAAVRAVRRNATPTRPRTRHGKQVDPA